MPSTVDYCPFCGARLSMDESLDDHFERYDECAESFRQWDLTGGGEAAGDSSQAQQAVVWVLVAAIMLYALVIQGSVLLGVIASAVVYVAGQLDWSALT